MPTTPGPITQADAAIILALAKKDGDTADVWASLSEEERRFILRTVLEALVECKPSDAPIQAACEAYVKAVTPKPISEYSAIVLDKLREGMCAAIPAYIRTVIIGRE